MNIVDILFTSGWVSTLFLAILTAIATRIFVLPKTFEKEQFTRFILMKRREERRYAEQLLA
ncbi:MAG: hypothetical protein FWE23_05665 [Chitinivibrionia bacterium]|nr:hypothetical protein [Chitinivibrionia bacterium]